MQTISQHTNLGVVHPSQVLDKFIILCFSKVVYSIQYTVSIAFKYLTSLRLLSQDIDGTAASEYTHGNKLRKLHLRRWAAIWHRQIELRIWNWRAAPQNQLPRKVGSPGAALFSMTSSSPEAARKLTYIGCQNWEAIFAQKSCYFFEASQTLDFNKKFYYNKRGKNNNINYSNKIYYLTFAQFSCIIWM